MSSYILTAAAIASALTGTAADLPRRHAAPAPAGDCPHRGALSCQLIDWLASSASAGRRASSLHFDPPGRGMPLVAVLAGPQDSGAFVMKSDR